MRRLAYHAFGAFGALLIFLALLVAAGGCQTAQPRSPELALDADVGWYNTTMDVLIALRRQGTITDDAYEIIDASRAQVRKSLNDRRAALADPNAGPTSPAYATALQAFDAAMRKLIEQKQRGLEDVAKGVATPNVADPEPAPPPPSE